MKKTELATLFLSTLRLIRSRIHGDGSCSYVQFETLRFIDEHQHSTMKEIADFLHITPPSTTSLVNSLVDDGKVQRVYDSSDRRIIRLALTSDGKTALGKRIQYVHERMEGLFEKLDEKDRGDLQRILEKIRTIDTI